jgi:hypothetical protein
MRTKKMKRRSFISAAIGVACAAIWPWKHAVPDERECDQPELEYNGVKLPRFMIDRDGRTCRLIRWRVDKCEDIFTGGIVVACRLEYRPVIGGRAKPK